MLGQLLDIHEIEGIHGQVAETVDGVRNGNGLLNLVEEDEVPRVEQRCRHHKQEQLESRPVPLMDQAEADQQRQYQSDVHRQRCNQRFYHRCKGTEFSINYQTFEQLFV